MQNEERREQETAAVVDDLAATPQRISREHKALAAKMSIQEARGILDLFMNYQKQRIRAGHYIRWIDRGTEPSSGFVLGLQSMAQSQEKWAAKVLSAWLMCQGAVPEWAVSQEAIGPLLFAPIYIELMLPHPKTGEVRDRATAGALWAFAGLDPSRNKMVAGRKRSWNARLKRSCFLLGESFKRLSTRSDALYPRLYRERKALEVERNEEGLFADQAKQALAEKNWSKNTVTRSAYEAGKLPNARLDLRATRYAVKMFLSHLQHVMYEVRHGCPPPKPFVIEQGGHAHYIAPPGWEEIKAKDAA